MTGHTFCCGFGEEAVSEMYDAIAGVTAGEVSTDEILTDLLPVVERYAKAFAAAEIRAIAHRLNDGGDEAIEVALGGAHYVHRVLCDTAHALDGKP